jgi:hypothetical protein
MPEIPNHAIELNNIIRRLKLTISFVFIEYNLKSSMHAFLYLLVVYIQYLN